MKHFYIDKSYRTRSRLRAQIAQGHKEAAERHAQFAQSHKEAAERHANFQRLAPRIDWDEYINDILTGKVITAARNI